MVFLLYNAIWVILMKNIQTSLLSAFESSGLTYDELARLTNLPKSALYRYINGDTEKIPIDRFQSVCNALHVDARDVLGWKEDHPDDPVSHYVPKTVEARSMAKGMDLMSEARRKALMEFLITMAPDIYGEGKEKDET